MPRLLSPTTASLTSVLWLLGCASAPGEPASASPADHALEASRPAASRPGSRSSRRDPQSAIEPRSAPGRGQEFLKQMAGEWTVVKTFHSRSGTPNVTRGECRQSLIHDGRFLQSDFVFEGDAGRTTGMGIIGFEADT